MSRLLVSFDTETGGLDPKQADILTFYMAILDGNFQILEEVNLKLKPDLGLPRADAGALKVNGINIQEHLADPSTITYSEGRFLIMSMLKRHLKKNGRYSNLIPMGQNVQFDLDMTWEHLISKTEWLSLCHYTTICTKHRIDFLKECGWLPSTISGLGSVVDHFGLPKRAAHNAREDTLMTVDVYRALLSMMESKKTNSSGQDLISLLEAE